MPLEDLSDRPRTSDAPVPSEAQAGAMFERLLREGNEDFKLSGDEEHKFRNAFGDPKFREMLADYMDEISDPKHRAEQEAYITKLENEDQVPEGKELVRPSAAFVVKTHTEDADKAKGSKVFINVVQSDKIAEPKATPQKGGVSYSLPLSLGPKRMESDKGGATVPTFDACFHPKALQLAKRDKRFKDLVVKTAMEHVEQQMNAGVPPARHEKLVPIYHTLKGIDYKNGTPAIMMMNKASPAAAAAAAAAQVARGSSAADAAAAAVARAPKKKTAPTAATPTAGGKTAQVSGAKKTQPAVKKGFLTPTPTQASPPPPPPPTSGPSTTPSPSEPAMAEVSSRRKQGSLQKANKDQEKGGPATPKHRLLERGQFRASDHMNDRVRQPQRPTELELEIELPLLASASHLELDVDDRRVVLKAKDIYSLDLKLPYPVFGEKGKAKFEKARKTLKVTMPVRPPEVVKTEDVLGSPDAPPAVEPLEAEGEKAMEGKEQADQASSEPQSGAKRPPQDHSRWLDSTPRAPRMEFPAAAPVETPAQGLASPSPPPAGAAPPPSAAQQHERVPEPTPQLAVQGDFTASDRFRGAAAGYVFKLGQQGLGYYMDGAAMGGDAAPAQHPPCKFQQNEKTVSVLVQVPGIVAESVRVQYAPCESLVRFMDKDGTSYAARLTTPQATSPEKSRHDVADKNMIVVLYKAEPGPWEDPLHIEEWSPPSSTPGSRGGSAPAASGTPASETEPSRAAAKTGAQSPSPPPARMSSGGSSSREMAAAVAPTQLSNSLIFELD